MERSQDTDQIYYIIQTYYWFALRISNSCSYRLIPEMNSVFCREAKEKQ
jgi:hypothetical protein